MSRGHVLVTGGAGFTLRATGAFGTLRTDRAGFTLYTLGTLGSGRARRACEVAGGDLGAERVKLVGQRGHLGTELIKCEGGVLLEGAGAAGELVDVLTELVNEAGKRGDVFLRQDEGGLRVLLDDLEKTLDYESGLVTGERLVTAEGAVRETLDDAEVGDAIDGIGCPVVRLDIGEGLGLNGSRTDRQCREDCNYAFHETSKNVIGALLRYGRTPNVCYYPIDFILEHREIDNVPGNAEQHAERCSQTSHNRVSEPETVTPVVITVA